MITWKNERDGNGWQFVARDANGIKRATVRFSYAPGTPSHWFVGGTYSDPGTAQVEALIHAGDDAGEPVAFKRADMNKREADKWARSIASNWRTKWPFPGDYAHVVGALQA